ncbi:hypothetical protein PAXRUDRAFT_159269 [Paxillus rubicundulus Ve08.2h10]|uniref:Cysteine protease n=1 Tax=Paxillus rubicundulus Ve08.2h10 TaxID=930991 RepID=A0A0D0CBI2_9AGAM|nr:hypothetical protein PAXRUDRAFT_159269 [Paxillus rubicundulus Ve08.2h10]
MSNRHTRRAPSPSSPNPQHGSKLSKFLQKQSRDRSKSLTDPAATGSTTSVASSGSSARTSNSSSAMSPNYSSSRNAGRFGGGNPKEDKTILADEDSEHEDSFDETPVIVEPSDSPRARTRPDRPLSTISDIRPSVSMYSSSSSARISDLPTRLSGWLSHTFSHSSTDLTLPSILSQSHMAAQGASSPKTKTNPLLTAAKQGKGHFDRAMRFLLDSDSMPDKCAEPIWLLGVQHPGYEPSPLPTPGRRSSTESRRSPSFRSNTSSSATVSELSQSQPPSSKNPAAYWPPVFYADFTSRIWLTYRNQFAPIRDSALSTLDSDLACGIQAVTSSSPRPKKWNWPGSGEKGWTSDAGWGCMLRTGQSLLANALLHLHLGRDWRRPPLSVRTNDFATYVQIITWFLDSPVPQAPFSVHRMALAGKDLGKDVGQWFGPSTAAGAIKTLVHAFPEAGLGVSIAVDGVVYQSDVYAASNVHIGSPQRHARSLWGGRPVLVLIGIRLGIDGVNPIYYEPIKALYTFPQSVGIAGGRPSSSYYFMGSQADNLFYLDPHHARPAVPLRPAPPSSAQDYLTVRSRETTPDNASDRRAATRSPCAHSTSSHHHRSPTSPSSVRTGSSTFSYHAPLSPSPLQHQLSTTSSVSASSSVSSQRWQNASTPASPSLGFSRFDLDARDLGIEEEDLDPVADHYVTQYSAAELRTFHCDRVRKMPLSGLDPSMLLGFLCKDESDWIDLRRRINELNSKYKPIFTMQDEPPSWPSDSDEFMGLESISEPDDMDLDLDDEDEDDAEIVEADGVEVRPARARDTDDQFFDTRSTSISPVGSSVKGGAKGSEVDTEEDPIGPITPGPNSMFEVDKEDEGSSKGPCKNEEFEEIDGNEEDDDEWVDPSMPTPLAQTIERPYAPPIANAKSTGSTGSSGSKEKGKKGKRSKKGAVPLVKALSPPMKSEEHFPFPRSLEESFHERLDEARNYEKRMNNTRARDGGRTESGGVRAVLMG